MNLLSSCKNSQTLNGTCTLLQVQRVSTVILCTEMQRENTIENSKNAIQMQVRVQAWAQKRSNAANPMGKLGDPDTENTSKWQSNDTQGAATHSRLLSKKTHYSDTISLVISLFLLRSNNSTKRTSQ